MPITSQAVVRTDDDPDLLTRIHEEASGLGPRASGVKITEISAPAF